MLRAYRDELARLLAFPSNAEDAVGLGGFGAEIAATIAAEAFMYLKNLSHPFYPWLKKGEMARR
jgi:hypothetical protein